MSPSEFTTQFMTQGVAETRRRLLEALATAPGLLLVEGPSGCGKSHLKQQISAALAGRFTLVDLAYSRLDPSQFATTLASCLSPGDPPAADPTTRMHAQITARARAGKPLLLLIDDAQFMPADTRAALAKLAPPGGVSEEAPVYGVLFADPGANGRFALLPGADIDQGLRQRISLVPPGQADMERFLESQAGHEALSPDTREAIVEEARGSLRRLRQLTDLALLEQASEAQEEDVREPDAHRPSGQSSQFAFGLVGAEDFPEPGPATRRALERGSELDALTASDSPEPPTAAETGETLPVLYQEEAPNPGPSRRPALRLGLLAGVLAVLAALLLTGLPAFQEEASSTEPLAQERPPSGVRPAETGAGAAAPASPQPAPTEQTLPEPEPEPSSAGPALAAAPESPAATEVPVPEPATAALSNPESSNNQDSSNNPEPSNNPVPSNPPSSGPESTSESSRSPVISRATVPAGGSPEIERFMNQARAHEAAYRLTLPSDDNAVLSYRRVLTRDPEHALARASLQRIQQLYRGRAAKALEQEDWEAARHNFSRLLWIDNGDREAITQLARLVRRLEQSQTQTDSGQQARQQQP